MPYIRIKLISTDINKLNTLIEEIKKIVKQTGVEMRGPICLPTKILRVPTMRTDGHRGTKIWETYQMRIHRRLIDIGLDERTIKMIMRIPVPEGVQIEMKILK